MKKITLILAVIFYGTMYSQSYDFSVSTETYQDLTGGVSLSNNQTWDDPEYVVPIGFDFEIGDDFYSSLYFELGPGAVLTSTTNFQDDLAGIAPVVQDLVDRGEITGTSLSPISYKLEGTAGERILKIEWENAGFYYDETGNDFISFQVWLYEETNVLEYHYGPSSITNPDSFEGETGIMTSFYPLINVNTEVFIVPGYDLINDPTNPTVVLVDENTANADALNGSIPAGTVYRFTPSSTAGVSGFEKMNFSIYPNPAENHIIISDTDLEIFQVEVFNSLGKKIKTFNAAEGQKMDISELSSGVYFIKVNSGKKSSTSKFIKQ